MKKVEDEKLNKPTKSDKKSLSSNPIKRVKSPIENAPMISIAKNANITEPQKEEKKELATTKKKLDKLIKPISVSEQNSLESIVETINSFNTTKTKVKSYNSEYKALTNPIQSNINYFEIMRNISDAFQNNTSIAGLFTQLNSIFVNKLKWNFVGFGLLHEKSKCINLKLYNNTGNTYSSKIFLSDENNPIINSFCHKTIVDIDNINYLNNPYLAKSSSVIFPMMSVHKCIGVMLVGQNIANINTNLVSFISNYMGMFVHNIQLLEQTSKYANTDTRDAKYLAEYITYCLSCCFVDDVGPVKVSVGISTYPDCSSDQEKLLILAEQAMFISQAKGYKEGMSAIVSSSDFNFWDDVALNSFAEVLAKRHSQIGINFEEELVHKFNNEEIINHNHLMEMVTSLAGAIDAKDPYTKGHSTSVSRYSEALARAINLPESEVERIKIGAMLHDVGKIGIPESVLKKPGKLTDEEWEIMKQHPVIGAEKVLEPNEALRDLIPIVKYHHERLDGKGYPEHLKGNEIPLAARIVSVADAYHALVSDRPYRKGMPIEKACAILKEGAGTQWDADLVRQFISIAPSLTAHV